MTISFSEKPCTRRTSINAQGATEASVIYQVQSTTQLNGFEYITGFPQIGDKWTGANALFLQEVTASEVEHTARGWVWDVECIYKPGIPSDDPSGGGGGGGGGVEQQPTLAFPRDPCDRPPLWSFDGEIVQEFPLEDLDGNKFLNAAGDPFDPGVAVDVCHTIVTVQKNLRQFNLGIQQYWVNGINQDSYQGIPKGYLRVDKMTAHSAVENEFVYWNATCQISYNPRGWWPVKVQNKGCRYYNGEKKTDGTNKKVYVVDDNGIQSTDPILLDPSGYKLVPGETPIPLEFRVNKWVSFSALLGS